MTELDEMKQRWLSYDRKLDEMVRLNRELLSTTKLSKARSSLQRLAGLPKLEGVVWAAIVIALGNFIYKQAGNVHFAVSGAALDVFAIGMLAATIRQIVSIQQIDFGGPVAEIQKQLGALRVLRIRVTQWGLLAGTVVWGPFVMVAGRVLFGVDLYDAARGWMWANVAFGLAAIPVAFWVSRKFGDRVEGSPFLQRLMREIAGQSLNDAEEFLGSVATFGGAA